MKYDVLNLGGPTFVHTVRGTVSLDRNEQITAEFADAELDQIQSNELLKVTEAADDAEVTAPESTKRTGKKKGE